MTTFVTALIKVDESKDPHRSVDTYLAEFDKLVNTGINLHVFVSPSYEKLIPVGRNIQTTVISLEDLDTYKEIQGLQYRIPQHRNERKDTERYLILMNAKTELLERSIKLNFFENDQYAWVDFGIFHIFKDSIDESTEKLRWLAKNRLNPGLYIPGCHKQRGTIDPDRVCWRFCGGFFIGDRASVTNFHELYRKRFKQIIQESQCLTWEVIVWAQLELEGLPLTWYRADHNDSILRVPTEITKSWTVVTAYFDLSSRSDAVREIAERDEAHYLRHAGPTLALEQNMVIFCEPKSLDAIKSRRPEHLASKTHYVVMEFSEFPLYVHLSRLEENRRGKWQYGEHNRNTPAYYLLCMARYAMLKKVIAENPFESTHFAWLNICIERMGPSNVKYLPEVFSEFRDKFSTCYIDYIRKDEFPQVIDNGRCSMCSGFFTGNAYYMKTFCDKIEEKFLYYLDQGYGHADEQLYSPIYFDHPEIFEVYYGDYTEMVTNYHWIRERASEPLRLLIRRSLAAEDFATCRPACEKLWNSFKKGYAELQEWEVLHLIGIFRRCLRSLGLPDELP